MCQDMPDKFIYEPWKAPPAVQATAKCIVGKDYPQPIVDHAAASKANMVCLRTMAHGCLLQCSLAFQRLTLPFFAISSLAFLCEGCVPGQPGLRQSSGLLLVMMMFLSGKAWHKHD